MSFSTEAACTPEGFCELCADSARPARVLTVDHTDNTARVVLGSEEAIIALDLLDDISAGDIVLVHQGFAIERVTA